MRFSRNGRLVAVAGAALSVLAVPALLFAHARLVRSSPAVDSRVDAPPTSLSLWFSERPELRFTTVQLLDSTGAAVPLGTVAAIGGDAMGVTVPIQSSVVNGRYTVVWRTAAADGHPTTGKFAFVVAGSPTVNAASLVAVDTARPPTKPAPSGHALVEPTATTPFSSAVRWAELMALLTIIGAVVFRLFILREARLPMDVTTDASDRARRLAQSCLVLFAIGTLWRLSSMADLMPDASGGRMFAMVSVVGSTAWGHGWLVAAIGAAIVAAGLLIAHRSLSGWIITGLGVVGICLGEGLTGHSGVLRHRASLATAIDLAHLLGAGGWIGGLTVLLLCGFPAIKRVRPGEAVRSGQALVRLYHRAALECVALVLISAVFAVWVRFSSIADFWTTPYGQILMVKVGLAFAVLGFGLYHWRTAVTPSWNDDTGGRFRRSATIELLVGTAVVAVTAILVSTALPPSGP